MSPPPQLLHVLATLTSTQTNLLYTHPSSCLAVFRILPELARIYILRLAYTQSIPINIIQKWHRNQTKHEEALKYMKSLHLYTEKQNTFVLHPKFRQGIVHAISGSGHIQSFGTVPEISEPKDIEFLDEWSESHWERILRFLVDSESNAAPADSILTLAEESGLIENNHITESGFQFLLQDLSIQVWTFLLRYLALAEVLGMEMVDVLSFFFQLGSLDLGQDYSTTSLSKTQRKIVEDLSDFGITYWNKRQPNRYYPTRLATTLTYSTASQSSSIKQNNYIILQTNFRLYAYTSSPLQISILRLFTSITTQFENMIAGIINRESVKNAFSCGITADQIVGYLRGHAHDVMRQASSQPIPLTVIDQINLWELERRRLKFCDGYKIHSFDDKAEFERLLDFVNDRGYVTSYSTAGQWIFIDVAHYEDVRQFLKSQR